MSRRSKQAVASTPALAKAPSGVRGLDAITGGGLPRGRPTLVCGGSGCGKTLFGMEFLVRGIQDYDEPGVFMCFEEREQDLAANVASLGFDLPSLVANNKLLINQVKIDRSQITETGEFSLDGLFIRLGIAIDQVGAKRVVVDTIETLFAALTNLGTLRSELRRLFEWLKDRGVTTIVTGERGENALTRHGLEEYVSDCVILLDQRVTEQVATRRLRIVKYRGSAHGTNEYPFQIDEHGFSVLPITSIGLHYDVSTQIVPTGIAGLDAMFGGGGYYAGGTLLVSGSAGTGKTSLAAHFVDAACRRGERCVFLALEESPSQIMRNMRSLGIDLSSWVSKGLLRFTASRPASFGLETHITSLLRLVEEFTPLIVVVDPISSFMASGTPLDARAMLMRLVDLLKSRRITALFTSLTGGAEDDDSTIGVSSMMDSWIVVRNVEQAGERSRTLSIVKSRGMKHSSQARELILTDHGVELVTVVVGPDGKILTGSARLSQQATDQAMASVLQQDIGRKKTALERKRKSVEAAIAQMQADLAAEAAEIEAGIEEAEANAAALVASRAQLASQRQQAGGSVITRSKGASK